MDIVLRKNVGVPLSEQITAQIELKILAGDLKAGERLPSVRAHARRLKVHSNTVSAAYRLLEDRGLLEMRRGSGVFVHLPGPRKVQDARSLDEMIRLGLYIALQRHSGAEVRAAVLRWLAGTPPSRVVVVDPAPEMGELLARELSGALRIRASACSVAELEEHPELLGGALGVALPYHLERVRKLVPGAPVESVSLEVSAKDRQAILELPAGAIILLVSHSPDVLHLAPGFVASLRGDELLLETRLVRASREWKRLLAAADFVFADVIAFSKVERVRSRRLREVRFLAESSVDHLRSSLSVVVPSPRGSSRR
ncbi:MAG TPA: GntR family transcriptional regulator [Vicinamibacteria bacterium]|jgi:GntR family transcriptional regulator|nr:GntR family transcriptional regulator [Vicinamibacteria bacterium]